MPRISRRTPRAHARLTVTQLLALVSGADYFNEWKGLGEEKAAAYPAMRAAWLEDGLAEPLNALHWMHYPGTRCWAWWMWEAPERRRRVDGVPHPHDDGSVPARYCTLYYGRPGSYHTLDHFDAVYESQEAYLRRLRLLTGEEQRLLIIRALDVGTADLDEDDQNEGDEADDEGACVGITREDPTLSLEQLKAWMAEG